MNEYEKRTIELYKRVYGIADDDLVHDGNRSEEDVVLSALADYHTDRPHAFHIDAGSSALVVVDMQVGFVDRSSPQWVPQAERMVPGLNRVAESARELDIPVIFTSALFLDPSPTDVLRLTPTIAAGNLAVGTPGLEIVPELWRDGDILVDTKHTYDAFFGTDLDYHLRGRKKDTIVIAGTLTNFCCEATARAGFDRGYHVVLASDLCASDNPWAHDATMQTIRRGFGRVVDSNAVIAEWQHG
jgi:nicotinamidase-related amidase